MFVLILIIMIVEMIMMIILSAAASVRGRQCGRHIATPLLAVFEAPSRCAPEASRDCAAHAGAPLSCH